MWIYNNSVCECEYECKEKYMYKERRITRVCMYIKGDDPPKKRP